MGTRNAIIVKGNGKILIQQYGQWDGYFGYQGKKVVEFVKNNLTYSNYSKNMKYSIEDFEENSRVLTSKQADKLIEDLIEAFKKNGMENLELKTMCPSLSRDIGADILNMVYRGNDIPIYFTPLYEINNWCEYVYIVDLDNLEVACLTNHKVNNAITYACPQVTEKLSMECFAKLSFAEIKKKSVKTITKDIKAVNPNLI